MPTDLTICVADVSRLAAIRGGLQLSGRGTWFNSANLASALDAIKANEPRLVLLDAVFAQTQQGGVFTKRIDALGLPECVVRLIIRANGAWTTSPRETPVLADEPPISKLIQAPSPLAAAAVAEPAPEAPSSGGANTRRAPRFPMLETLNAVVETGHASLVNISVLGAQIVSLPVLRPGQTVKIALPDAAEMLRLTANVAWSSFQQTKEGTVVYRAGVAFTDAAQETLDNYCKRYGAEKALPTY
jgi:hypothetical protein